MEFRALELQERPCVGELIFVGKSGGACGLATPAPCLAAQVTFAVGTVSTFWLRLLGFGVLPMMVTNEDLFVGTKKRFILPRVFVFLEGERGKTERTRRAGLFFFFFLEEGGMVLITGIEKAGFLCRNVSTRLWKKGSNTSQRGCTLSYFRNKFWSQSLQPVSSDEAGCLGDPSQVALPLYASLSSQKKGVTGALVRSL